MVGWRAGRERGSEEAGERGKEGGRECRTYLDNSEGGNRTGQGHLVNKVPGKEKRGARVPVGTAFVTKLWIG